MAAAAAAPRRFSPIRRMTQPAYSDQRVKQGVAAIEGIAEIEKDIRQIVEEVIGGLGQEGLAVAPRPVRLRQACRRGENLPGSSGKCELEDMPPRSTVSQSGRR